MRRIRSKCRWRDVCMGCCRSPAAIEASVVRTQFAVIRLELTCNPEAGYCEYCEADAEHPRWDAGKDGEA